MKFQPGDKVSFINEKQQGVVKKNLENNMVVVEIEDGFEFPVRENELVKTGTVHSEKKVVPEIKENIPAIDIIAFDALCADNTAVIAAIPEGAGTILTGPLSYHLINRSQYDLLFTFYIRKNNEWKGLQKGLVVASDNMELQRFRREELIDIQSCLFMGLLYHKSNLPQVSSIRHEFAVLLPSLQHAKKEIPGIAAFAATTTVFSDTPEEIIPVKDLIEKYQAEKNQPTHSKIKHFPAAEKQPSRYGILENEKEIDLHIEELVEDFSGLSNAEMISIQLKHFSKEMDNAMKMHFRRVIFIHGVGNGKLKNEIRKELGNYPGIAFKDADNRKYGYGATEVTLL